MARRRWISRLVPGFIRRSFKAKLFLAVMLPATLAVVDTSQYIGRLWWRMELHEVQYLMFATVVQMAESLDADTLEGLARSADPASEAAFTENRTRLLEMLKAIQDAVDARAGEAVAEEVVSDVYILAPTDEPGIGRFILAKNIEESGRTYDMSRFPKMIEGWERPTVESIPVRDEFGMTLSAYAPIRDEAGVTVAIVGLDAEANYFFNVVLKIAILALLMLIGAMLFSVLCAWWLSRQLTRSLRLLTTGMRRVSAGDLDARVERQGSGDEFDQIFSDFNRMVDGLRNRQEIEMQLADAGAIQTGLLPSKAPIVDGYDIAGGIRYCEHAGGDYYDYLPITTPDGARRWGITIGDVTGHGIRSALTMCSCRAALRSAAGRDGDDLPAMLREVNHALAEDSPGGAFMTMFLGALDPASGRFTWTSAGHDPGLLIRQGGGDAEQLMSTDIPLGISDSRTFDQGAPVTMQPGDVLVIGTDGISQARNSDGEFFGFDRITAIVRSMPSNSARTIRDRIFDESHAFAGGGQLEDDATLVVLQRLTG